MRLSSESTLIGSIFALGLGAAPWIIAQNFREQIPLAIIVFVFVFLVAVLMFSTAIAMRKKNLIGSNWQCSQPRY